MTNQAEKFYNSHLKLSRHCAVLEGINKVMQWDQETCMPPGGATIRSEQLQTLAGIIHKERTSKKYISSLSKLIDIETGEIKHDELSPAKKAAIKLWRRDLLQQQALPNSFVKKFAQLTSESILIWRNARKNNNFEEFAPYLDKIVEMNQQKAEYLGYDQHPYDALLNSFEPEMTTEEVTKLFNSVKKSMSSLLKKINLKKQPSDSFLHGKFSEKKQMEFGEMLIEDMGIDTDHCRIDFSTHPFSSSSHPSDSRITTRIHPTNFISNILVLLHEGGHSQYEMGLPEEHYGSPLAEAISLGIHESQSQWWEAKIGMSKPFWKHYLPVLRNTFKGKLDKVTLNTFYKAINKVEPSLIRVEADEVTYPLHVIVRFELEKALIEGTLEAKDVPTAWNHMTEELLGIVPENDRLGCLQDIHWSLGGFGYFPTYTLGNMYAAQLFEKFEKDHPDWEKHVSRGNLEFIKEWLHKSVHKHGRRYSSKDLIKKVTGKKFSEKAYINYIENKYKELYKI
ncbi:MAG: carboxypeptidase M32 [Chlamydiota bacterium]|nr:carboxypeptidase M32 [Chlamydiota bacterium]